MKLSKISAYFIFEMLASIKTYFCFFLISDSQSRLVCFNQICIIIFGSGALHTNMLLVTDLVWILENNNIDAYLGQVRFVQQGNERE